MDIPKVSPPCQSMKCSEKMQKSHEPNLKTRQVSVSGSVFRHNAHYQKKAGPGVESLCVHSFLQAASECCLSFSSLNNDNMASINVKLWYLPLFKNIFNGQIMLYCLVM